MRAKGPLTDAEFAQFPMAGAAGTALRQELGRRQASPIAIAITWAAKEGWNLGMADAEAFWAADPEGFLIAVADGAPLGCVSAVRYGPDFGFIDLWPASFSVAVNALQGPEPALAGCAQASLAVIAASTDARPHEARGTQVTGA